MGIPSLRTHLRSPCFITSPAAEKVRLRSRKTGVAWWQTLPRLGGGGACLGQHVGASGTKQSGVKNEPEIRKHWGLRAGSGPAHTPGSPMTHFQKASGGLGPRAPGFWPRLKIPSPPNIKKKGHRGLSRNKLFSSAMKTHREASKRAGRVGAGRDGKPRCPRCSLVKGKH